MASLSLQLTDNSCSWGKSDWQFLILKRTCRAIFGQKIANKPNVNMQRKLIQCIYRRMASRISVIWQKIWPGEIKINFLEPSVLFLDGPTKHRSFGKAALALHWGTHPGRRLRSRPLLTKTLEDAVKLLIFGIRTNLQLCTVIPSVWSHISRINSSVFPT